MKNYYTIYPGPNGLVVESLGELKDFDAACETDAFDERLQDRQPSIWIANDEDLASLSKSIRVEYKGS